MSAHQDMIDRAMNRARTRMSAGRFVEAAEADLASNSDEALLKEASELADALEFSSLTLLDDGTAQGELHQQQVVHFFKQAAAGAPIPHGPTTTSGSQPQPGPDGSKRRILPLGLKPGAKPEASEAPEGETKRSVMEQPAPAVKQVPTDKKAGTTLFDMLMNSKEAARGGPAEFSSTDDAPGIPSANENSNRQKLLGSNAAISAATKRQAKQPGRARLAELFNSAHDTVGDQTAQAIWPQAATKGDMKIASLRQYSSLASEMAEQGIFEELEKEGVNLAPLAKKTPIALSKAQSVRVPGSSKLSRGLARIPNTGFKTASIDELRGYSKLADELAEAGVFAQLAE
jgi:hypothetical protein